MRESLVFRSPIGPYGGLDRRVLAVVVPLVVVAAVCRGKELEESRGLVPGALSGNTGMVQRLLNQGIDVNAKDEFGDTALMYASAGGHAETVELLLSRAADVNARNVGKSTALDKAKFALPGLYADEVESYRNVIRLLQEAGAEE